MNEDTSPNPAQTPTTGLSPKNSVQDVFESVCDLPADQRDAAIANACRGDVQLKRQVETLLRAHDNAGEFMAEPTTDLPDPYSSEIKAKVGDEIDRYKPVSYTHLTLPTILRV